MLDPIPGFKGISDFIYGARVHNSFRKLSCLTFPASLIDNLFDLQTKMKRNARETAGRSVTLPLMSDFSFSFSF